MIWQGNTCEFIAFVHDAISFFWFSLALVSLRRFSTFIRPSIGQTLAGNALDQNSRTIFVSVAELDMVRVPESGRRSDAPPLLRHNEPTSTIHPTTIQAYQSSNRFPISYYRKPAQPAHQG